MRSRVIERIGDLAASEWNALDHRGYPFFRHEFLAALENSGCIGLTTGWRPYFIVLEDDAGIAAAAPLGSKITPTANSFSILRGLKPMRGTV